MGMPGFENGQRKGRKRVAIYARVSSDIQDTDKSVSFDEQIKDARELAERNGELVVEVYRDVDPGWKVSRPGFQRMLEDGRRRLFDKIIVWRLDRVSRGFRPMVALMDLFDYHGVDIEAVMEPLSKEFIGFSVLVGKMEIDALRDRTTMGRRGMAKQGRVPLPQVLYGYCLDEDCRPQIDEDEAQVVREIYRLSTEENLGHRRVSDTLNRLGIPSPGGGKLGWTIGRVSEILSNETYHTGIWYYGKTKNTLMEQDGRIVRQLIPRERSSWIEIEFPTIISRDLYREARQCIERRRHYSKRNTNAKYLLQRMVRCVECNLTMNARTTSRSTHIPRRYYICGGMYRGDFRCRPTASIPADLLEQVVWHEFCRIIRDPNIMIEGVASQSEAQGEAFSQLCAAIESKERVRGNVERELEIYMRQIVRRERENNMSSSAVDEVVKRMMNETEVRLREVDEELEDLRRREEVAQHQMSPDQFRRWTENIAGTLDNLDFEERQSLLRTVIEEIKMDGDNNVTLTAAIPVEDFVAVGSRTSSRPSGATYDRRR